ncbi:hypothetical protein [Blastopirellula retiformator]|uniref:Uncharacterized protein n=1 Tax=Blastopirellula retiformator TaxID=2527970 RepID=A0A5C5V1M4_9BACT|nr:hypothetical protein [Blastopirellula retiformator]TWT31850.1 hypothetical protein Enr8_37750 [Blastopirellula retiformator]
MSDAPHSIRLNGPWQVCFAPGAQPTRVNLPRDWSTLSTTTCDGALTLTRFFNAPTGLVPGDQVMLVLDALPFSGNVTLNGAVLGDFSGSRQFSIVDQIELRNQLEISGSSLATGQPAGEVRLEIFAS